MQASNHELHRHQKHDGGRDTKKLLQIDAHAALNEHHTESNCRQHAHQRSQKTHQLGGIQTHGGKNQHRLRAFPQHHQKDKNKESEPGVFSHQQSDLAFDFALHLAPGLHHENNHGDDKKRGQQHDPAFKHILV